MGVRSKRKTWLLDNVIVPFFGGIYFVVTGIYKLTLAWWLATWRQRKSNRALLDDLQRDLYFLVSEAKTIKLPPAVIPFDYAEVEILWRNVFFSFTRGRGEINVSVAPRHARNVRSQLGPTIAALEGRNFSAKGVVDDLADAAALLRPRMDLLNAAFSEQQYSRTRERV
jgi:hypothetical protein